MNLKSHGMSSKVPVGYGSGVAMVPFLFVRRLPKVVLGGVVWALAP